LPVAGWTGLVAVLVKLFDSIDAKGYLARRLFGAISLSLLGSQEARRTQAIVAYLIELTLPGVR
jgi:hypothetical protein